MANGRDPCQAVDGYGSDAAVCMLPDIAGGTVPSTKLCGAGTSADVEAPDGSGGVAARVTVFRNNTGYLFVNILASCDWLLVVDANARYNVTGAVSYAERRVAFSHAGTPGEGERRFTCATSQIQLPGLSSNCQVGLGAL
ncbi:hypothetical protein FOA52_015071 [Chlamydomonas sp. UWO 241]|nr:hypothetical protein FOA52_015071 [Chlamydomonas sp. UWO 241]